MPAACFLCVCMCVQACVYYRTQGLSVLQKVNVSTENNSDIKGKKPQTELQI